MHEVLLDEGVLVRAGQHGAGEAGIGRGLGVPEEGRIPHPTGADELQDAQFAGPALHRRQWIAFGDGVVVERHGASYPIEARPATAPAEV